MKTPPKSSSSSPTLPPPGDILRPSKIARTMGSSTTTPASSVFPAEDSLVTPQIDSGGKIPAPQEKSPYVQLSLSPETLEPYDQTVMAIQADGIWNEGFAKNNSKEKSLIYFLYGRKYAFDETRNDRIRKVKAMLDKESGNRARLYRLALSKWNEEIWKADKFDSYFQVVTTFRILFSQATAKGGFPGEVFLRFQRSRNCYIAAACMWYALQSQVDTGRKNDPSFGPPDISRVARRFLLPDDKALEDRVIKDKGGNAVLVARELVGGPMENWSRVYLGGENGRDFATKEVGSGKFGFAGSNPNTEGVFISLQDDEDDDYESEYCRLKTLWRDQLQPMATQETVLNSCKLDRSTSGNCAAFEVRSDTRRSRVPTDANKEESSSDEHKNTTHAMVLLGTVHLKGQQETSFVLLNSWESMPLLVVSGEYLGACKAAVCFHDGTISRDTITEPEQTRVFVGECDIPDEGEDGNLVDGDDGVEDGYDD